MKMDEYLEKRKKQEDESFKKLKELEETQRKAKELKESLKAEKKMKAKQKMENFSLFGMHFRPWTLNDMCIVLFFIAILVVGGLFLVPGEGSFSDLSGDDGFFTKLFSGISGSSVTDTNVEDTSDTSDEDTSDADEGDTSDTEGEDDSDTSDEDTSDETRQIDFKAEPQYGGNVFTSINATGEENVWYNMYLVNSNSFNMKCKIDHFVNDELKDQSSINVLSYDERTIAIREVASDAVDGLSRVKLEVKCYDEGDSNSETIKTFNLKFYFS